MKPIKQYLGIYERVACEVGLGHTSLLRVNISSLARYTTWLVQLFAESRDGGARVKDVHCKTMGLGGHEAAFEACGIPSVGRDELIYSG